MAAGFFMRGFVVVGERSEPTTTKGMALFGTDVKHFALW